MDLDLDVGPHLGLLSLVVPVACAGCAEPDVALCRGCRDRLVLPAPREVNPHAWARPGPAGRIPVFSAAPYEGVVRELLVAWKDGGRLDLAGPLAEVLARVVAACLAAGPVAGPVAGPAANGDPERRPDGGARRLRLVPVPSSRAAVRRRGEDVMFELAGRAASSLDRGGAGQAHPGETVPAGWWANPRRRPSRDGAGCGVRAARLLAQRRGVRDQAGLSTAERLANTAGGLRRRWSWDDRRPGSQGLRRASGTASVEVVLVDDIVTTGASLAAAAAVLAASGVRVVGAATVAWTPRRRVGTSVPHSPALRTVGYRRAGLAWTARPDERGEAPRA